MEKTNTTVMKIKQVTKDWDKTYLDEKEGRRRKKKQIRKKKQAKLKITEMQKKKENWKDGQ